MTTNGLNGWLGTQETIEPLEENKVIRRGDKVIKSMCLLLICKMIFASVLC